MASILRAEMLEDASIPERGMLEECQHSSKRNAESFWANPASVLKMKPAMFMIHLKLLNIGWLVTLTFIDPLLKDCKMSSPPIRTLIRIGQ